MVPFVFSECGFDFFIDSVTPQSAQ